MKLRHGMTIVFAALAFAALACSQAGEILTPEEATQRASSHAEATVASQTGGSTDIPVGASVKFVSPQYLVLMRKDPGSALIAVQSEAGAVGTVLGSQTVDDKVWYQIETTGGVGWLPEDMLEVIEGEEGVTFEVGDTAYLVGSSNLQLLRAPGNNLGPIEQAPGTEVTILQTTDFQGETWYRVNSPGGVGWVRASEISAEAP